MLKCCFLLPLQPCRLPKIVIKNLRPCLDAFFSSLNFHHSSLKIPYLFGTITHLSSLNIFHTIYGPHTCHSVHFFFQYPNSPNPVKKKKKKNTRNCTQWRKKKKPPSVKGKKKMKKRMHRTQWKKKKRWSKVATESDSGSLHVVLFTEMPLKTELWKLKTSKMCF